MYLGIDLGTSEVKLLLLADTHRIVAVEGSPLSILRPRPLWSEQHPRDWWAALDAAMVRLRQREPQALAAVRAIGLSGQMHGAVLVNTAGEVLRPAILWNDGRSTAECAMLEANAPGLHDIAGNLAMPGFTAPKLLWVKTHEPQVFERIDCVLLPKDWLRLKLTDERFTDCSDASGTLWLDVGQRHWSPPLLAACGLSTSNMPALVEGNERAGTLRDDMARRWGLLPGIPVAGGGGDNAASAVGIGAVAPGRGFVSLGTSGVIFVSADRFVPDPGTAVHAFCHALPGRWHQMSVMLSAASAVRWAMRLTGQDSESSLMGLAEALSPGQRARVPIFLPYLSGERTPHNDASAQGVLFGLSHEHGPAEIAQAVVEGVSFGLLDGFDSLDEDLRDTVRELTVVGGGARSSYWARLLATVLNRPLELREGSETGAALGAARLAWMADGAGEADVCRQGLLRRRFEPDIAQRDALLERHRRFRELYPALRGHWQTAEAKAAG